MLLKRLIQIGMATISLGIFAQSQEVAPGFDSLSLESLLNMEISTAAKYSQKVSEAPASVTLITAEEIASQGYKTLNDVLLAVRSFYIAYDRDYGHIGARGFGKSNTYNLHILLLLNGHTINENVFGSAPSGSEFMLDPRSIERIEIVRGPGSALYGTGAVLAVINVITKRGDTIDGLSFSGMTGSFGKFAGSALLGREFGNGLKMTTSASFINYGGQDLYFKEYDDSLNNYGWARNLDSERGYGLFTGVDKNNFKAQLFASWREKEIPTGEWNTLFNVSPCKNIDSWNYLDVQYEKQVVTNKNIWGRVYYNHYYYHGWYPYEVMNYDKVFGDWLGGELQLRWDIGERNRLTIGGEIQDNLRASYKAWMTDYVFFNKNVTSNLLSLYVQDEYQLFTNLSTTIGLRRDRYSDTESAITPRLALIYNIIKPTTVKILYGEAFRRANIYETYYEDPSSGNKPNFNIKSEKTKSLECDIEQRISRNIWGSFSMFRYNMHHLIDQVLDPVDSLLQFDNINRVEAFGAEVEMKIRLTERGFYGYANYSYNQAEDEETKLNLANYPAHTLKFGGSHPMFDMARISTDIIWEDSRLTVYNTRTNSFWMANLKLSVVPFRNYKRRMLRNSEAALQIRNIFDTDYSHPASLEFQQAAISQDGRNVLFTITIGM